MSSISCIRPANTWCNKSIGTLCAATVEPPCGAKPRVWHHQSAKGKGEIAVVSIDDDATVRFNYAVSQVPVGGTWDVVSHPFSSGTATWVCVDKDEATGTYYVAASFFDGTTHTTKIAHSTDFGAHWAIESFLDGAAQLMITCFPNGDWMRYWFEYNSGTSGPGVAKGQYHFVGSRDGTTGGPGWTSTVTFLGPDRTTPIPIADGGMGNVQMARDAQKRLTFTCRKDGDTAFSTFYSEDQGTTWSLVT